MTKLGKKLRVGKQMKDLCFSSQDKMIYVIEKKTFLALFCI